MQNILETIVDKRRHRIKEKGFSLARQIPEHRQVPLLDFGREPFVICEIKRKSPSKGMIRKGLDPLKQAEIYRYYGVRNLSILTEEEHFAGSMDDLMNVKNTMPDMSVLRKDFLLEVEDIDISYRAGADAVLLIASILSKEKLARIYARAKLYGISCLVELHDEEDVDKVRPISPSFVGINCRNLRDFSLDPLLPLKIKSIVDWPCSLVYESGITSGEQAALAASSGFAGCLVGEAVVRNPEKTPEIIEKFMDAKRNHFWNRIAAPLQETARHYRPLVKICGLTRTEDVELAESLGADLLGFIFASSPRKVEVDFVRSLPETRALKVGVVVAKPQAAIPAEEAFALLNEGKLDAIQFHGDEGPEYCFKAVFPYYKALRLRSEEDLRLLKGEGAYRCPRILLDAFSAKAYGGTGKQIDELLLEKAADKGPLWLAGGLGPFTIGRIISRFRPELIDASSSLESRPGKKDREKMKRYFKEIENACS